MELRRILTLFAAVLWASCAAAQTPPSTVNPNIPIAGTPVEQSGPALRQNFLATMNDINALWAAGGGGIVIGPGDIANGMLGGTFVQVQGLVAGVRCPLIYAKGTKTPTGLYGEILNVPSGFYWEPQYDNNPVKACQFGTIPDGVFNSTTNAVTGTDNWAIIQAALNYALQFKYQTVCLNDGSYVISDTLQMGWGDAFYNISLTACNLGRAPAFSFNGTDPAAAGVALIPTKTDRCGINIQGGRNVKIEAISLWGQNYAFGQAIRANAPATPYPATNTGWLAPALNATGTSPGGIQRYSPYAGICIDAYSGATPPNAPYPNQPPFPPFTGLSTQYNKSLTSNVEILNVGTYGFGVGISSHSSNINAQGDFIKIREINCISSVYCISIGNSQARNTEIYNVQFNASFTVVTSNQFGLQTGFLGGPICNLSGGGGYQIFQLGALALGAPFTFCNIYAEAEIRVGVFDSSNGNQSITFDGLVMNQQAYGIAGSGTGRVPAALIEVTGVQLLTFTFRGCGFGSGNRIEQLVHGPAAVVIDGGLFNEGVNYAGAANNAGIAQAYSYTGSLLIGGNVGTFPNGPNGVNQSILRWLGPTSAQRIAPTTLTSITPQNLQPNADFNHWGARAPITQAVNTMFDIVWNRRWDFIVSGWGRNINFSLVGNAPTPIHYTGCDTVAFTYLASLNTNPGNQAASVNLGDILYWPPDGTFFVVTSVAAPAPNIDIVAVQMNNMTVLGTTTGACVTSLVSDPTLNGLMQIIHTGGYLPENVYFGNFTNGSTSVTSVTDGNNSGASMTNFYAVGDRLWSFAPLVDIGVQWPIGLGTTLSAVTNGSAGVGGTITLSVAAKVTGRYAILPLPTAFAGVSQNILGPLLFAVLPPCVGTAAAILGLEAIITDSTTATPGATITGAGALKVSGICNSANNWVVRTAL